MEGEQMDPSVKCLLGKQEDLGLDSHTLCESHMDSVTICNLSPPDQKQEAEMREFPKAH